MQFDKWLLSPEAQLIHAERLVGDGRVLDGAQLAAASRYALEFPVSRLVELPTLAREDSITATVELKLDHEGVDLQIWLLNPRHHHRRHVLTLAQSPASDVWSVHTDRLSLPFAVPPQILTEGWTVVLRDYRQFCGA